MFRNKEIRRFALLFALIAALSAAAGFAIHLWAGILSIVSGCLFALLFIVFTRARYKNIAQISEEIDLVLHNADHLFINDAEEGELSILQSEITKMTLRIREQNDALKKEKNHLAESLADIAHQLRTPLTSANLMLTLLKNAPEERERRRLLREMEELFIKMDWHLTTLLKLSRLDGGIVVFQKEPVEVGHLVDTALRPLLISMELHNITLEKGIPANALIQGDINWLSEALQNILKNCMESAGDDGSIAITCRDNILFTEITFHDSGPGFKNSELPCLFDRFYRGKHSASAGFGIGLALCKTIITRQGGSITARNHPKGGAVFVIRFPK